MRISRLTLDWRRMPRLALVAKTAFRRLPTLAPARRTLHQLLKLFPLLRRQHRADLLARLLKFLTHFRVNAGTQLAHAFLALGHDLAHLRPLLGAELQAVFENLDEFAA